MNVPLALAVFGLVLTVQDESVTVDKGVIDGLRPNDTGNIFYYLTVDSQKKRIAAAVGEVLSVEDFNCKLKLTQPGKVAQGFFVEFEIPKERTSPASLLEIAQARVREQQFDSAMKYLEKIQTMLPDDSFVQEQIRVVKIKKQEQLSVAQERQRLDYYETAARYFLDRGDADSARPYLEKIQHLAPNEAPTRDLLHRLEGLSSNPSMLLIPRALYEIGVDLEKARFYNQHPRFQVLLNSYWIDRFPVLNSDFKKFKADFSFLPSEPEGEAIGITFEEADGYCRWRGGRLPTEFEWEVAAQNPEFGRSTPISEWTSSWYKPYPDNVIWEEEYGEKFRVVRGRDQNGGPDNRIRLFRSHDIRDQNVGFRCARDAEAKQ